MAGERLCGKGVVALKCYNNVFVKKNTVKGVFLLEEGGEGHIVQQINDDLKR